MIDKQYLKILLKSRIHDYHDIEIENLNNEEINNLIVELKKSSQREKNLHLIDYLKIENGDFYHLEDDFKNFRYIYILGETKQTYTAIELLINPEKNYETKMKFMTKTKDKTITELISDRKTEKKNEFYFSLNKEETEKLYNFIELINTLKNEGFKMENVRITHNSDFKIFRHEKSKVITLTDNEIMQIGKLRNNELNFFDAKNNINVLNELSEVLQKNNYTADDMLNYIKNKEINNKIVDVISDFETKLNSDTKEKEWQDFFHINKVIFSFLFGEYKIQSFNKEAELNQRGSTVDKIKVETVDFKIDKNYSYTLIEMKNHDMKLFEKSSTTRENVHLSKDVHNGIMQLMYYINPKNPMDDMKNKIKKKNYLIIGDEENSINNGFSKEEKEKAIVMYNEYLNSDIQLVTYRMVLNMLVELEKLIKN